MHNSHVLTILCVAGGLLAMTAFPVAAQQSSGGTPPGVTEGKGGTPGATQPGQTGNSGQDQSITRGDQRHSGPMGEDNRGSSAEQRAKSSSDTMGMEHAGARKPMGTSMSQAQRSGGSQGTQEQMYEDRMKGFQESPSAQGTKNP